MTQYVTWIGIISYAIGACVTITWIGIALANWLANRHLAQMWLGLAALFGTIFIVSLAAIASDWFPQFEGIYVALMIRLSFFLCMLCLGCFTFLYLRYKREAYDGSDEPD